MYFGRCLVTGAHGFLGPSILEALLAHGNQVVALERGQSPEGNYDLLVHAAPIPLEPYRAHAARAIVLSSGAAVTRDAHYLAGYADDKRALEAHARAEGVQIARIYALLGPGIMRHPHLAAAQFFAQAVAGGPVVVRHGGVRSYLHPRDLARALLTILAQGDREPYDVGGEEALAVAELGVKIAQHAGVACHVADGGGPLDVYLPDLTRLHALGWRQTISVDAAIADALAALTTPA